MVQTYPAPEGIAPSPDYQVEVEGQPVFVYNPTVRVNRDQPVTHMALAVFDFSGPVSIKITSTMNLEKAVVRPKRLGIRPAVNGNSAVITLEHPCKITFEPGDVDQNALAICAGTPLELPEKDAPNTVYYGPGVHEVGTVQLQSGWTYILDGGAHVRGHLQGEDLEDVKIIGRGVLDRLAGDLDRPDGPPVLKENPDHRPAGGEDKRHFIALARCKNIHVEGLTLLNGAGWGVVPWACEDLVFRDINLIAEGANADGMDVCSSQRVLMEGLFIRNWDDCVVLKARNFHNRGDCTDITVRDCVFWVDLAQGLEIGFECECDLMARIVWKDIDIIHMHHNCAISIHNAGSALVEDVLYENIWVEDLDPERFKPDIRSDLNSDSMRAIDVWVGDTPWWSSEGGKGRVRNVRFKNVHITTAGEVVPPSRVAGFDAEHTVEDVVFENVSINGKVVTSAAGGNFQVDAATTKGIHFVASAETAQTVQGT